MPIKIRTLALLLVLPLAHLTDGKKKLRDIQQTIGESDGEWSKEEKGSDENHEIKSSTEMKFGGEEDKRKGKLERVERAWVRKKMCGLIIIK